MFPICIVLLTLVSTLKVLTPSSTALSTSSMRLSVEPRITIVEMAPSSLSVHGDKYQDLILENIFNILCNKFIRLK